MLSHLVLLKCNKHTNLSFNRSHNASHSDSGTLPLLAAFRKTLRSPRLVLVYHIVITVLPRSAVLSHHHVATGSIQSILLTIIFNS